MQSRPRQHNRASVKVESCKRLQKRIKRKLDKQVTIATEEEMTKAKTIITVTVLTRAEKTCKTCFHRCMNEFVNNHELNFRDFGKL